MDFNTEDPLVLNVLFHVVKDSTGVNVHGIEEYHLLESIARLNMAFNQFNIFFKYRGSIDILDSYFLYCPDESQNKEDFAQYAIDNEALYPDTINIYCTAISSSATYSHSLIKVNVSAIINDNDRETLIHEMGHALHLLHTFHGTGFDSNNQVSNIPSQCADNGLTQMIYPVLYEGDCDSNPPVNGSENVTRDTSDPNYNADCQGDKIADTHAIFEDVTYNCYWDYSDYPNIYKVFCPNPEVVDLTGEMYDYLDEFELYNYMNYFDNRKYFSEGQGVKMRDEILNYDYVLPQKLTTVESLYEPYLSQTIPGDVVLSTTDLGNGFIETCYNIIYEEYYQPGFTYNFGEVHYEADLDPIVLSPLTTSIEFNIEQLGDATSIAGVTCTRGQICFEEPIEGGKVISFKNINDPNFTIQALDQQQASDPNLIEQLEGNKFHNIEKTSNTGNSTDITIYKDGN
jgi:hypothetical protein